MSLKRKIVGHTAIQVSGRFIGNVIGVIVVALLTRYLGQEGFGNYTTILAYLFFFGSLSDLGLYMITINELKKPGVDRHRFYSAVFSLRLFTGFVLMILAGLLIWLFPYPMIVKQGVIIISLSILFTLLEQIQTAFYQTEMTMVRPALADAFGKVVIIVGVIIGIAMNVSLLGLLWAVVVGHGVQFVINMIGVVKRMKLKIRVDWEYWRNIVRKTWPIAVSQVFVLIYFKMDAIFLSLLRPAEVAQIEVGLYGAPYKILEVLIAFVPLFMGLITPVLSWAWASKKLDEFKSMYQKAFDAFSIITWPLVIGGVVLARHIIDLIAPGFAEADKILMILMVAVGVIFFTHLPHYTINTIGEQRRMLRGYALAAVLATALYITLIPQYSFYAAAGITVVIELLILVIAWLRVRKVAGVRVNFVVFGKAMLASLIMGGVLYYLRDWNVFVLLILGGVIYGVVMLLVKGVTKELIWEIVKGKEQQDNSLNSPKA
jgi:O-antigen/teichoic acid export membrane protein